MNAATKTILAIALGAVTVIVLFVGGEWSTGLLSGAGAAATDRSVGAGFGAFGGYLTILVMLDVALGTVVAWMLFGNRE